MYTFSLMFGYDSRCFVFSLYLFVVFFFSFIASAVTRIIKFINSLAKDGEGGGRGHRLPMMRDYHVP